MKNILTFLVVVTLLLAAGQAFASEVTNVELSYINGATVANINVDGAIRFTHQTEEAKDGKPFRVIVDVMSATHMLGANNFLSLPDCPVKGIRTSQFSVTPEAVVRIVFDMDAEQVYRVESTGKSISVVFDDKAKRSFAAWSTASVVAASKVEKAKPAVAKVEKPSETKVAEAPVKAEQKSAAELNKSIKKDHLASLESKPAEQPKSSPVKKVEKKAQTKTVAKVEKAPAVEAPKATTAKEQYGPFVDASLLEPEKPAKAESKPVVVAKVNSEPAPKAPVQKKQVEKSEQTKPAATKQVASKPVPAKEKSKSVTVAKADKAPAKEQPAQKKVAQADAEKTDKKSSTSRFRRSPVTSKKIKGTLVAEFPKRLVIKYKTKGHRDPFATLIDESKTNDDPIERQVPNVEGLKLVGVIEAGGKNNRALFEDNEGYGYMLQSGDKVQKGYVLRVESDRVYFQIFEYGWSRTVALHLDS